MAEDRAHDSARVPEINSQAWIQQEAAKIVAERKAKAAPNSPESRGNFTDATRLH